MEDLNFTHVYERARSKVGITRDEYALVNYIATWAGYPGSARPGWSDRTARQKATFIGITERGILKMQKKLLQLGLIEKDPFTNHYRSTKFWFHLIHEAKEEQAQAIELRKIGTPNKVQGAEQSSGPDGTKFGVDTEQSSEHTPNKVHTHNKGLKKVIKEVSKEDSIEPVQPVEVVVEYLNRLTGSTFRHTTKATFESVNARLKENYQVDELLLVVEHKVAQWGNDQKMREYLRPITLFGKEKFEGYLQAAAAWLKSGKPTISKNGQSSNNGNNIGGNFDKSTAGAFN